MFQKKLFIFTLFTIVTTYTTHCSQAKRPILQVPFTQADLARTNTLFTPDQVWALLCLNTVLEQEKAIESEKTAQRILSLIADSYYLKTLPVIEIIHNDTSFIKMNSLETSEWGAFTRINRLPKRPLTQPFN